MRNTVISKRFKTFPPEVENREDNNWRIHDFSGVLGFCPDFLGSFDDKRSEKRIPYFSNLCDTFINYNADIFDKYNITARTYADKKEVLLSIETHDIIGAFPLKSPTSGLWKHYMMIHPKQGWDSFGNMLSVMGMKQVPKLEPLPIYPYSSRDIPTWVIASIIITRLEDLFKDIARHFYNRKEYLSTPKGRIDWLEYISRQLSQMKILDIPCDVSVIQDNQELMSFIRYTLKKLQESLLNVKSASPIVSLLLTRIDKLMRIVLNYLPVRPPFGRLFPVFFGKNISSERFHNGLQAIEWTNEDRGLAGDNEFTGLAWSLNINDFFEAYVETVTEHIALLIGGSLKIGRIYQTSIDIVWEKQQGVSQKHLRPDFIIELDNEIIILDAKYKGYWQLLDRYAWKHNNSIQIEEARDSFRADILQVLAYSTCFNCNKIKVCLVYPCMENEYIALKESGDLHQKAFVGERSIEVIRTLVPMSGNITLPAQDLANYLLNVV